MNNREIIDYILSGSLTEEDVIKKTTKDPFYENGESISYITNDGYTLYDDNGPVSILSFRDDKSDYTVETLAGHTTECTTTYEIVSREQYQKEIDEMNIQKEITYLRRRLAELESLVEEKEEVKEETEVGTDEPVEEEIEETVEVGEQDTIEA